MSSLDWEYDEWRDKKDNLYLPDLHLRVALRRDKREYFHYKLRKPDADIPKYLSPSISPFLSIGLTASNTSINSESLYPLIWMIENGKSYKYYDKYKKRLTDAIQVSKILTNPIVEELLKFVPPSISLENDLRNESLRSINSYQPSDEVLKSFMVKTYLNEIKYHMAINLKEKNKRIFKNSLDSSGLLLCFYNDYYCSFLIEGTYHVYDYDQILMLSDNSTSRYLSYLVLNIYSHISPGRYPNSSSLNTIYKWGDDIITRLGNEAYNCIKQFEPICTAVCLNKFDDLMASKSFYQGLKKEYLGEPWEKEIDVLHNILQEISNTPLQLMEIFGMYRHFGHPTVDEEMGCSKMREHTRAVVKVDDTIMKKISGAFKLNFVRSFIKKTNRWPRVDLKHVTNKTLRRLATGHVMAFDDYTSNLTLLDWHTLHFCKEFEFDYYYDFTELLKDTSIAPYMKNWQSVFDPTLLELPLRAPNKHSRRVLIEVLQRKNIDIKEICDLIMKEDVPISWKIIVLHAKEREISIPSRLFAMLVLEMRLYFGVTESNMKQIFKFVSGQTMTMGEGELQHHLMNISDLESTSNFVPVTVSVDYKKWNNYQRYENNFYIFESVEELFETPGLYNYTHKFFQQCSYVLGSRDHPPKYLLKRSILKDQHPEFYRENIESLSDKEYRKTLKGGVIDSDTTWVGQDGGCEGQRQKGWTLTTNSMLKAIEFEIGIKSMITGQGDNQVIVIYLPIRVVNVSKAEYIRQFQNLIKRDISQYMQCLEDYSSKTGIKIKPQESWVSSVLYNYGKEILFKACFLTNVVKKISRAFHTVSESYPSLGTRIASIHTACHSASNKGTDSIVPYFLAVTEISIMLMIEAEYSPTLKREVRDLLILHKTKIDMTFLIYINLIGKDFGGYPIMSPLDYIYRGHPDPVTSHLSWLKILSNSGIQQARLILLWIISLEGISDRVDISALIQDPVALNFECSTNYTNVIKNTLVEKLKSVTKNKDLSLLLQLGSSKTKAKHDLVTYLSSVEECSPRILNDIFRNSPEGARLNFILTFTDMRTLKNLFSNQEQSSLNERLSQCDISQLTHLIVTIKKIKSLSFSGSLYNLKRRTIKNYGDLGCMSALAQDLREASWGRKISHVTTPHPSEQFSLTCISDSSGLPKTLSEKEHVLYIYTPPSNVYFDDIFLSKGRIEPYEGSTTREKKSQKLIPLNKINRSINAAQNLFRLLCWVCDPDSSLGEFIKQLIQARTDVDLSILKYISGINYGGSIHHRFNDVITKHTSRPNIRINLFSSIYMSSDNMGKFARGLENWTMHYQGIYLYALSVISLALIYGEIPKDSRVVFYQTVSCEKCCVQLIDTPLTTSLPAPQVKPIKNCKLLYSTSNEIVKDLNWGSLDFIRTDSPRALDPFLRDKRALAISYCILGVGNSATQPILITPLSFESDSRMLNTISIASILQVGIKEIVNNFALIWFYDHLRDITQCAITYKMTLDQAVKMCMVNVSKMYWSHLKSLMLIPEIQNEVKLHLQFEIVTPLSYLGEDVFYRNLTNYMINHLVGTLTPQSVHRMKLYCVSPGMSFLRNVLLWISALAFTNYDPSRLEEFSNLLTLCHNISYTSLQDGVFNFKVFYVKYLALRRVYPTLPNIIENPYSMNLSLVGPEPWCKSQFPGDCLKECSIHKSAAAPLRSFDQKIFQQLSVILKHEINNRNTLVIPRGVIIPESISADNFGCFMMQRPLPDYSYHIHRQTGTYTTSHYKFLDMILSHLKEERFDQCICLADGSGGVSNLLTKVFKIKRLIYNSLVNLDSCPSQRLPGMQPPELQPDRGLEVLGVKESLYFGGDLRDTKTVLTIKSLIDLNMTTILTCDLELGGDIPRDYQIQCLKSILQILDYCLPGTVLLMKHFLSDPTLTFYLVNMLLYTTNEVTLSRSLYSDPYGDEVFILLRTCRERDGPFPKSDNLSSFKCRVAGDFLYTDICRFKESLSSLNLQLGREQSIAVDKILTNKMGYSYNYQTSLLKISAGLIRDYTDELDLLRQIGESIETLTNLLVKRVVTFGKIQIQLPLNKVERSIHGPTAGENKDLTELAHCIYTLILLRDYIWIGSLKKIDFDQGLKVWRFETLIYTYSYNQWEWGSSMGRHFYRVVGSLNILK